VHDFGPCAPNSIEMLNLSLRCSKKTSNVARFRNFHFNSIGRCETSSTNEKIIIVTNGVENKKLEITLKEDLLQVLNKVNSSIIIESFIKYFITFHATLGITIYSLFIHQSFKSF
jgi:hypothetical protein